MADETQTRTAPPAAAQNTNNGGGATPWLAFLVGVLLVAVVAFGAIMWWRQAPAETGLTLPESVDVNIDMPKAPDIDVNLPEAPKIDAPAADAPAQ